jgi:hypothetical protein
MKNWVKSREPPSRIAHNPARRGESADSVGKALPTSVAKPDCASQIPDG